MDKKGTRIIKFLGNILVYYFGSHIEYIIFDYFTNKTIFSIQH